MVSIRKISLLFDFGGSMDSDQSSLDKRFFNSNTLSVQTQSVLRGWAILWVVFGHSLALLFPDLSVPEQIFAGFLARFTTPSVFFFVFLIGYSQSLKRKRLSVSSLRGRTFRLLIPYGFWASVVFLLITVLPEPYWFSFQAYYLFWDHPLLPRVVLSLFTFTLCWQYYFLVLFIFFQWYTYWIRKSSVPTIRRSLKVIFIAYIAFLTALSGLLWFSSPEEIPLGWIGIFLYSNPLAWMFSFYLGAYCGITKVLPVFVNKKWNSGLFWLVWIISSLELLWLIRKWGTTTVVDQFSLSGFAFGLVSLGVFIGRAIRREQKPGRRLCVLGTRWLSKLGNHSFLIYLLHLPFQWYWLVLLEQSLNVKFPMIPRLALLMLFGLSFPYAVAVLGKKLPQRLRKTITGV